MVEIDIVQTAYTGLKTDVFRDTLPKYPNTRPLYVDMAIGQGYKKSYFRVTKCMCLYPHMKKPALNSRSAPNSEMRLN